MARYKFVVKGCYPSGNKAKMTGYVTGPATEPGAMVSSEIFDAAVKACEDITPGLIVDRSKPGQIVITKLKK